MPCAGRGWNRWSWRRPTGRPGHGRATTTASRSSFPPDTAHCPRCPSTGTWTATRTGTRSSPTCCTTPTAWTPTSVPGRASGKSGPPPTAASPSHWRTKASCPRGAWSPPPETFGRPHHPALPGLEDFAGTVLHAAEYRVPEPFAGQRAVVVGAGNSAAQIAAELAAHAQVTLATRHPVRFTTQRTLGRDLHWWLKRTGADTLPLGRFLRAPPTQLVIDDGRYRAAIASGAPDRRPVFTGIDATKVTWADGSSEEVNTILLATGYRPDLGYLAPLGARRARRTRTPTPPGGRLAHPPRPRLRGTGVAAQSVLELPPRGRPGREPDRTTPGGVRAPRLMTLRTLATLVRRMST